MYRRTLLKLPLLIMMSGCSTSGCYRNFGGNFVTNPFLSSNEVPYGPDYYPKEQIILPGFEDLNLEYQKSPETCWAAAIQATYMYNDVYVSQDELIAKVRGGESLNEITAATLTEVIEGVSEECGSWSVNNGISRLIVQDLIYSRSPVIIGIQEEDQTIGHIVVVYGVTVLKDQWGYPTQFIDKLYIWDPEKNVGFDTYLGMDMKEVIKFALHSWNPNFSSY